MAVKNLIASGAIDPNNPKQQPLPAEAVQGHLHALCSTVELVAMDITSTVKFGTVPSNARFSKASRWDYDAIAGVTDVSLGLGKTVAGVYTAQAAACLVLSKDAHLAGNTDPLAAVDIANLNKAAWEIAGYTADPGGNLDVVATFNAAPTAGGTHTLSLLFATP
jgi:hypothetical protein